MNDDDLYSSLNEVIENLERERKRLEKSALWYIGFICLLLFGMVLSIISSSLKDISFTLFVIFLIFLVISFDTYSYYQQEWKNLFKRNLIGTIVKKIFPEVEFYPEKYIPEEVYHKSRLFELSHKPDRYTGENLLEGKVGNTRISISEIHSEYETETTDSSGRTHAEWYTIFRGLFIVADFNKNFKCTTIVLPERLIKTRPHELERAKLEDPEFEKNFDVFTDDQIEARYILTPALMERILNFMGKVESEIKISFIDSNIYLAISTDKTFFKPAGLFSSLNESVTKERFQQYLEELNFMLAFIDDLALNTRIWGK